MLAWWSGAAEFKDIAIEKGNQSYGWKRSKFLCLPGIRI